MTTIATEFDRIYPSQVDLSISGNGQQEAGHVWHQDENVVGWFCAGGNTGNPVAKILNKPECLRRLAEIEDGAECDLSSLGINDIVEWLV